MVFSTINIKHWDNNTNTGTVPAYLCTNSKPEIPQDLKSETRQTKRAM